MEDIRVPGRALGAVDTIVDGDLVVLSPKDFSYLGIVGAGDAVWQLIDGQRTITQIVQQLKDQFDAPEGVIERETTTFLEQLEGAGLVTGLSTDASGR